jgi:hypothetical protein
VRPDELERRLRAHLDALGPAPRAELLHVLRLPDSTAPTQSAPSGGTETQTIGELLIDLRRTSRRERSSSGSSPRWSGSSAYQGVAHRFGVRRFVERDDWHELIYISPKTI